MNSPIDTGTTLRSHYEAGGGASTIFSGKVADYLASRPDYPDALFDALPMRGDVADIGAGTGLLTQAMLARGCAVVAVEPNAEMRAACDHLLGSDPRYRSHAGTAEATGLPDASVDLITAAQAFHWFDIAPARREAVRVLRPAGQVALIWNDRVASDPLHAALDLLFTEFGDALRRAMVRQDERVGVPAFFGGAYATHRFAHEHRLGREDLQSLAFSRSYMPLRGTPEGQRAAESLADLFSRFEQDGTVAVRYTTLLMLGRPAAEGATS